MSRLNDLSQGIADLISDSIDGLIKESIDSIRDSKDFNRMLSAAIDDGVSEQLNLIDWSDHITDDTILTNVDVSAIIESEVQGLVSSVAEDFEVRVHGLEISNLKHSAELDRLEDLVATLEDVIASLRIAPRPTLWHRLCVWSTSKLNGLKRILGA